MLMLYKYKDLTRAFSFILRIAIPEIAENKQPIMKRIAFNYVRHMNLFVGKQLLYFGYMKDWEELLIWIVLVPIFTIAFRKVPRKFFVMTR